MTWVIAGILFLIALYLFGQLRVSHQRRLNLTSYVTYLLLSDQISEDHREKLLDFLRAEKPKAEDAASPGLAASGAIEDMADQFSEKRVPLGGKLDALELRGTGFRRKLGGQKLYA